MSELASYAVTVRFPQGTREVSYLQGLVDVIAPAGPKEQHAINSDGVGVTIRVTGERVSRALNYLKLRLVYFHLGFETAVFEVTAREHRHWPEIFGEQQPTANYYLLVDCRSGQQVCPGRLVRACGQDTMPHTATGAERSKYFCHLILRVARDI